MKLEKEDIIGLYKQVNQYCKAKYGGEPDIITMCDDGDFEVIYKKYARGDYTEEYYIYFHDLSEDLEKVYDERKKEEEKQRLEWEKQAEERRQKQAIIDKEHRKAQYLKLKQEFQNEE